MYLKFDDTRTFLDERWYVGFECNDYYYIFAFQCSGEGSKHYPEEVVNHMIDSIECNIENLNK